MRPSVFCARMDALGDDLSNSPFFGILNMQCYPKENFYAQYHFV